MWLKVSKHEVNQGVKSWRSSPQNSLLCLPNWFDEIIVPLSLIAKVETNCHLAVSLFICNAFPNFPADYQSWNWAAKVHLMLCSRDFPKYKTSFCQPQWEISNNIDLFKILAMPEKWLFTPQKWSVTPRRGALENEHLCPLSLLDIGNSDITLSILAWLPQFWYASGFGDATRINWQKKDELPYFAVNYHTYIVPIIFVETAWNWENINNVPEFVISLKMRLLLPGFAVNQSLVQRENNYALVDKKN